MMASNQPMWKTTRTATKKARLKMRQDRARDERDNKAKVRRRDRGCRFPRCGCRKLGLKLEARPEVSHDKHKGMGGNPSGDRSTTALMVQLCGHRHQDAPISRHKGTLRTRYLTDGGYDGAVAWCIEIETACKLWPHLGKLKQLLHTWPDAWTGICVATESRPGVLEPLAPWQLDVLDTLAKMDL